MFDTVVEGFRFYTTHKPTKITINFTLHLWAVSGLTLTRGCIIVTLFRLLVAEGSGSLPRVTKIPFSYVNISRQCINIVLSLLTISNPIGQVS